jgi:hypothetical protein
VISVTTCTKHYHFSECDRFSLIVHLQPKGYIDLVFSRDHDFNSRKCNSTFRLQDKSQQKPTGEEDLAKLHDIFVGQNNDKSNTSFTHFTCRNLTCERKGECLLTALSTKAQELANQKNLPVSIFSSNEKFNDLNLVEE